MPLIAPALRRQRPLFWTCNYCRLPTTGRHPRPQSHRGCPRVAGRCTQGQQNRINEMAAMPKPIRRLKGSRNTTHAIKAVNTPSEVSSKDAADPVVCVGPHQECWPYCSAKYHRCQKPRQVSAFKLNSVALPDQSERGRNRRRSLEVTDPPRGGCDLPQRSLSLPASINQRVRLRRLRNVPRRMSQGEQRGPSRTASSRSAASSENSNGSWLMSASIHSYALAP